jgi:hypothetical protein
MKKRDLQFKSLLDFRFWILDFGFWILDFGFWILDFGFSKHVPTLVSFDDYKIDRFELYSACAIYFLLCAVRPVFPFKAGRRDFYHCDAAL